MDAVNAAAGLRRLAGGSADADRRRLSVGVQVAYGAGQVAGQIFRDLPSLLLLFFLTTVLGIAPALAGAAIFLPKLVWGVGADMLVGRLSDRLKDRLDRRWWLLLGAVGAPVAMLLLFRVPAGSQALQIAYVIGFFSLYMLVFACFSVPYLAIASELADTPRQRSVLMAWRLVFTAVGILLAGAVAPALVQRGGGGQPAYEQMSLLLAILCPAALLIAFVAAGRARRAGVEDTASTEEPGAIGALADVRGGRALLRQPFAGLVLANLLQLAGQGMSYAALLYFLSYNMARVDALTLVGGIVLVACAGIVVAQPIWVALAERFGKRRCYAAAAGLHGASLILWGISASLGAPAALILSFVGALGNSGWAMLGFSIVADISAERRSQAGLFSAAWVATDKIAFALGGTLIAGTILSLSGFDAGRAATGLAQPASALTGVMIAFGLLPGMLNLLGGAIVARLPLL